MTHEHEMDLWVRTFLKGYLRTSIGVAAAAARAAVQEFRFQFPPRKTISLELCGDVCTIDVTNLRDEQAMLLHAIVSPGELEPATQLVHERPDWDGGGAQVDDEDDEPQDISGLQDGRLPQQEW
jgi:hypothetical protein